ncbi:zinc finger protein 271 [Anopheles marshallii]|uniref:zinc finger protein 271 n=1 Tax=Anopheles marshallii TaxID=1521116 RepID=UPI00237AF2DF|nr:zinc finger protein 271 [Anopheles marshallii]
MDALKCRFCLEPHYPASGSFSILNLPFSIALKRVFSFEVKSEQHLPDYACKVCSSMVWKFYTYSVMVEDNQHKLQQECSSMNAVTPRNLAGGYRMNGHEHLAIKREPIELSNNPVPTCSNNAAIDQNSQHSIKAVPQDEASTPHEAVVSREVVSEVMAMPPVSEDDDDGSIKLEEYVLQPYIEESDTSIAEKVTQELQAEDENSSTRNMMDYDNPADETTEPDASSTSSSHNNAHNQTQTEKDQLILCDKCESWFANLAQLRNHQRIHKTSECPICKRMIKGDFISQHLAAHEGAFHCDICDATFGCSSSLRIHKDLKHADDSQTDDEKFPCKLCEQTFQNKTQLSRHQRQHKMARCNICNEQIRSTLMQNHMSVHRGAYHCEVCKKPFSSRTNLMRHKRAKHTPKVLSEYIGRCDRCGLTFPNQTKLSAHIKGHQRKQCHICKKEFRPNKIKEHLASHDGAFRCGNCKKTFSTKYSLKKHNRVSTRCTAESSDSDSEYELSPESTDESV